MNEPFKQTVVNEIFRDFLVTVTIVAALFGILYVYYQTRHRERMAQMEKGVDLFKSSSKKESRWPALKFGILCIGLAIGVLSGDFLSRNHGINDIASFLSMTLLFGGTGLVIYFFIEARYRK